MDPKYLGWGSPIDKTSLATLPPEAIVARCLFGEARGESLDDKLRVGCVIRNRVRWHLKGAGVEGWAKVILKPYQFSWTMDSDPNLKKVLNPMQYEGMLVWEMCCRVAEAIVPGTSADTTQGSDHYYDKSMDRNPPDWVADAGMTPTVKSDRFRFFRSARVKEWAT